MVDLNEKTLVFLPALKKLMHMYQRTEQLQRESMLGDNYVYESQRVCVCVCDIDYHLLLNTSQF